MIHRTMVLSFQEGTTWMAWSLDFDLMGQGENEDEARENLHRVLALAIEDDRRRGLDPWSRAPCGLEELYETLGSFKESVGLYRMEIDVGS